VIYHGEQLLGTMVLGVNIGGMFVSQGAEEEAVPSIEVLVFN
jgi:hypothetical protein